MTATKVSKAFAFKERFGYSLTMAKNMKKYGCKTVEEYREVRKKNKKARPKKVKKPRVSRKTTVAPKNEKKKK